MQPALHLENTPASSLGAGRIEPNWKRIPQLDGVRGVAVLLVVIWHYYYCVPTPPGVLYEFLKKLTALSWAGVDLFFVLSGFLIGGILIDHKEDGSYFKVFYIRRICRIFPLYFLILAAFGVYCWILKSAAGPHFPFLSYALFLQSLYIVRDNTLGHFFFGGNLVPGN